MYFLDVYKINNPYTKEYERLEEFKTKNLIILFEHLGIVREKYDRDHANSNDCIIILTSKGAESRVKTLDIAMEHLAYKPDKLEIN